MRFFLLALFCGLLSQSFSQSFTDDDYYLFPINPGEQNFLAGTMGELRASHFHAGLDIKTGGQIGLPVHAAASGYVYRIKIATGGYGNALYLNHPNGTTTVYGHLDEYSDVLKEYIVNEQYKQKQFEVDLFPGDGAFRFEKGEIIGYSGNSGSSSGPHLHFEIRNRNQRILDPLKFDFPEIKDNMPPFLKGIAFVSLDESARVNEAFGRYTFDVIKADGVFKPRAPISLEGNIGIEIYAYDLMDGVWSRNGIAETVLVLDDDTVFREFKANLSFGNQKNILVHYNYPYYVKTGQKYNRLYVEDGNTNDIYTIPARGIVFDNEPHELTIIMRDSYDNMVKFETSINNRKIVYRPKPDFKEFEIYRNYLHFEAPYISTPSQIYVYFGKASREIVPYRIEKSKAYYLWDLRNGLPDSIDYCGNIRKTGIKAMIPSAAEQSFYSNDVDLLFRKTTLFDTLYLQFEKSYDSTNGFEEWKFNHRADPLKAAVRVTLKSDKDYPFGSQAYTLNNGRLGFVGGSWDGEKIEFYTQDLVNFTIANDTISPTIKPVIINSDELYFKISDDLSGIKTYNATLDGEFVLMKYEPKKSLIWSEKKDKTIPFNGEFVLDVEDNAGNKETYTYTFK
ncbi:MAG: M23 family metallopeptidase [Bacteroidota bacterium]